MSEAIDPYYSWLGIPAADQPADYYRLLGINRFESNEEAIANAAERQIRHVRTFQLGENARRSQTLLNELATARGCLLNAASKATYDQHLHAKIAGQNPPPVASPVPAITSPVQRSSRRRPRNPRIEVVKIVVGGVAGLTIGVLLLWYGFGMDVLGVMESRDDRLAKRVTQNDAEVRRAPPRKEETRQDGTSEPTQPKPARPKQVGTESDTPVADSLPEVPQTSFTPPLAVAPFGADDSQESRQNDPVNYAGTENRGPDLRLFLSGKQWDWGDAYLTLKPDGYVDHPSWNSSGLRTRWEVVDRRTVLLIIEDGRKVNRYSILCFSEELGEYVVYGFEFSATDPLSKGAKVSINYKP